MKKSSLFIALIALFVGLSFNSCKKNDNNPTPPSDGKINPSTIATANLIAYWGFEGTPQDSIEHRGTASSAVTYPTGQRGKAFQGGPGSYISFPVPATDALATLPEYTIAMWVKAPGLTDGVACFFQLSSGDTWNGAFALFQDNYGDNTTDTLNMKAYFQKVGVNWAGQWVAQPVPAIGDKWIHYVLNYSAATSTATIYINGGATKIITTSAYNLPTRYADDPGDSTNVNKAATLGSLNLALTPSAQGVIGDWANVTVFPGVDPQSWLGNFHGMIDELRIYNKALSDQEVKDLYTAEVTQVNP